MSCGAFMLLKPIELSGPPQPLEWHCKNMIAAGIAGHGLAYLYFDCVNPIVQLEITVMKIFTCFDYDLWVYSLANAGFVKVVLEFDIQQVVVIHLVFVLHLGDISFWTI